MANRINNKQKKSARSRKDLVVICVLTILAFVLAVVFQVIERLADWAAKHDTWMVEEVVPVFVVLSLAFGVFSWRRSRELRFEILHLEQAEKDLLKSNIELEARINEGLVESRLSNEQFQHELGERLQTEQALRSTEQQYRQIVDHANDIIYRADRHGNFTFCNPTSFKIMKYEEQELIGLNFLELVRPDFREAITIFFKEQFVSRTSNTYFEFPAVSKDGSEVWLGQIVQLLIENERIVGFQAVARNITERKLAEEALRRAEEYRNLFKLANDPIFIFDADGIVLDVNNKACETYGIARDEFIGHSFIAMSQDTTHAQQQLETFLAEDVHREFETVQLGIDGTQLTFNVNASIIEYQGRRAVLCINRDVTERKRAEEEHLRLEEQLRHSQKMEAIGQLAGGIAHDFNNLITVVTGYSELILKRPALDASIIKNVEEIKKAGTRAASLTRQLLAFSRKQVMQPKVLDLNIVVGDMDTLLRRLIGEDINFVTLLNPELGQVKADPGQIEQVLMNLVVNARDAMPQGGKITVETGNVELLQMYPESHIEVKPGRYVLLTVSDTGIGMDAATQERVFEPFFTTKEVGKGTGLGLSTAFGIVKQSGGDVRVNSEVGTGTTFKVYLPRVDEPSKADCTTRIPVEIPTGTETILLVEDEETVRRMARHILEANGHTVLEAANGIEAIQLCHAHDGPLHLVLSDVVMPQMSGPSVVEKVIQLRPGIKALFMSGYTDHAVIHYGVREQEMAFLQKPFTPDALVLKVREVLDFAGASSSSSQLISPERCGIVDH